MNIRFGKIKKKDWEPEDFISPARKGDKERHYYFEVNTGAGEIHINDTCGRSIPIHREYLSDLINVLLLIEVNS